MRLACQCDGYLPDVVGGMEVLSAALHGALRRRGHEILVLTSCKGGHPPGTRTVDGVTVRRLDFWGALQSGDIATIARAQQETNALLRDFAPDLLHLNDTLPSAFFFLRRGITQGTPRVLTLHSPLRNSNGSDLQARLLAEADAVIAVSEDLGREARRLVPPAKLAVIANALPLPERAPAPLPGPPCTFLCAGRLVADKGFDLAIAALATLRRRGVAARLVVAGSGMDKPDLAALAQNLGVAEAVEFRGWISPDDVPALIDESAAVLVPSRWREPFGLIALQAAQRGRPVIAARTGGLPEIVADGLTGLLVAPDDSSALADAMARLAADAALAASLGGRAREQARIAFDFETFVSAYEGQFESVRGAPNAARSVA